MEQDSGSSKFPSRSKRDAKELGRERVGNNHSISITGRVAGGDHFRSIAVVGQDSEGNTRTPGEIHVLSVVVSGDSEVDQLSSFDIDCVVVRVASKNESILRRHELVRNDRQSDTLRVQSR